MILNFKYGFLHKGFEYGWNNKDLYRLPSKSSNGKNYYGLKKLKPIIVGVAIGYRIKRDKFSINQLKEKTILINKQFSVIEDKDCPF